MFRAPTFHRESTVNVNNVEHFPFAAEQIAPDAHADMRRSGREQKTAEGIELGGPPDARRCRVHRLR